MLEKSQPQSREERREAIKSKFAERFPEVHKRMTAAEDPYKEYAAIIAEYRRKFSDLCREQGITIIETDDTTAPVVIKGSDQTAWDDASGEDIEHLIQETLDGLERLQDMTDPNDTAAQILYTGLMAVGSTMMVPTVQDYLATGIEAAATLAGVEAATVGVVVGVAVIIVLSVLIPFIYFMDKPAQSVTFVINKSIKEYAFKDDYCVHGKRVLYTESVDGAIIFNPNDVSENRYAGGLYSYCKRDEALIGSQAAFKLECGSDTFCIGVKEPLNGDSGIGLYTGSVQDAADAVGNSTAMTASLETDNLSITAEMYPQNGPDSWVKVIIADK